MDFLSTIDEFFIKIWQLPVGFDCDGRFGGISSKLEFNAKFGGEVDAV